MAIRIIVIVFLLMILYCLGSGVFYLAQSDRSPGKLVKALSWRISLSIALFALLFVAYFFGWLVPHMIFVVPPFN